MARTERESDRRREVVDLVLPRLAKRLQNGAGFRQRNLSILGLLKRKERPQCHRESSWQVLQSGLCQKEKEQSRLFRASDPKEGIQWQRSKENSSRGKRKRRVFLCRRTVRVKAKSKVISTCFLKIEGRGTFVGAKDGRKRIF